MADHAARVKASEAADEVNLRRESAITRGAEEKRREATEKKHLEDKQYRRPKEGAEKPTEAEEIVESEDDGNGREEEGCTGEMRGSREVTNHPIAVVGKSKFLTSVWCGASVHTVTVRIGRASCIEERILEAILDFQLDFALRAIFDTHQGENPSARRHQMI